MNAAAEAARTHPDACRHSASLRREDRRDLSSVMTAKIEDKNEWRGTIAEAIYLQHEPRCGVSLTRKRRPTFSNPLYISKIGEDHQCRES